MVQVADIRKELWSHQNLCEADLDYNAWRKKRTLFKQVAALSHSCFFTVDVFRNTYDFASAAFSEWFGYKKVWIDSIERQGDFFEGMTHPDDLEKIISSQIAHSNFIYSLPPSKRNDYSTIYSLRMRNLSGKYLNVISRQKVIQQDRNGKAWIILGEVTLLPQQTPLTNIQSLTINLKTGQLVCPSDRLSGQNRLSSREEEVFRLMACGCLSKEIAGQLCISVNTVNNHRKNILRKLQAGNAIEAINAMRSRHPF